jgi:hypothetical protein
MAKYFPGEKFDLLSNDVDVAATATFRTKFNAKL